MIVNKEKRLLFLSINIIGMEDIIKDLYEDIDKDKDKLYHATRENEEIKRLKKELIDFTKEYQEVSGRIFKSKDIREYVNTQLGKDYK